MRINSIFKRAALVFLTAIFLCSCKAYYVGETARDINMLSKKDTTSMVSIIPAGSLVLFQRENHDYSYVIYGNYKGYFHKPFFKNHRKYDFNVDGTLYGYPKKGIGSGSTKKKSASTTYSNTGGSVNVKGYYRKNGTYVKPYTRSSSGSYRRR